MQYFLTFLEGIISFISPCMLPMLPIYVTYFAGGTEKKHNILPKVLSFILGFTVIFCLLGVFAAVLGALVVRYNAAVNVVCGSIVILMGLGFLDIIRLPFFKGMKKKINITGVFSSFIFGVIFAVSLTPCVGAFLSAALGAASISAKAGEGAMLLLAYSLGMGVPFLLSAVLIDKLSTVFGAIKKHYKIINTVCGIFLIIVGISMILGFMGKLLGIFGGAAN